MIQNLYLPLGLLDMAFTNIIMQVHNESVQNPMSKILRFLFEYGAVLFAMKIANFLAHLLIASSRPFLIFPIDVIRG
jgi:hypothetical protein